MTARTSPVSRRGAREPDFLEITGAREHNLAIQHLTIPKRQLVVFTGPSGSGKSSLAFDTLYAEGQRRYIQTLSAYARQFLGQLDRPKVDHLRGLSPTIAIEQKSASSNPRSTVGTITEIYDYLRVLYAKVGEQHCPVCGKKVQSTGTAAILKDVLALGEGAKVTLLAPLVTHRKGEFRELFDDLRARGFVRVMIDKKVHALETVPALDKKKKHTVALVVDRITVRKADRTRLAESVDLALREGKGEMVLAIEGADGGRELKFSQARSCCGQAFGELSPQNFSFNSPLGMCPDCTGLGQKDEIDPELIVPDETLSIRGGAIAPWAPSMARGEGWTVRIVEGVSRAFDVDLDLPWQKLPKAKQKLVLYGAGGQKIAIRFGKAGSMNKGTWGMRYEGVVPNMQRKYRETASEATRDLYRRYLRARPCEACGGKRLSAATLAVKLAGRSIAELTSMTVLDASRHIGGLDLPSAAKATR
jgi:excinuclease ABC subunit A